MAVLLIFGSTTSLELSVNPLSAYGSRSGSGTAFTNFVTVSAINGSGPFSFAWTRIEGDTINIESPSNATTRFTAIVPIGDILSATFRCTVTDAFGNSAFIDIFATLVDSSWSGGVIP